MSLYTQINFIKPPESAYFEDFIKYKEDTLQFCEDYSAGKEIFKIKTSGSTGTPKLIEVTRSQMALSAKMTIKALGLSAGDTSLVCLNTSLVAGMMMLVRGIEGNMNMTVIPPVANPFEFIYDGQEYDFTAMVPYQVQNLLHHCPEKLSVINQMKALIIGGAPVSKILEDKIQQIKSPVYSTYGMTETLSHIALKRINGNEKTDYFKSLPGVKLGVDERGCLTIQGDITNNKILITNDLVDLISDHQFFWVGRADNVINTGGIKIQLETLEEKISGIFTNLNILNRFFIYGLPDEKFGTSICLVIEENPIETKILSINNILKEKLQKYEVPKKIITLEKFIETSSAKIDRIKTVDKLFNKKGE